MKLTQNIIKLPNDQAHLQPPDNGVEKSTDVGQPKTPDEASDGRLLGAAPLLDRIRSYCSEAPYQPHIFYSGQYYNDTTINLKSQKISCGNVTSNVSVFPNEGLMTSYTPGTFILERRTQ